ncbi:MAG: alpha/beta hydrolase, partial [Chloroflexi bacterium]|nr:alpha/beta hydrolase [Chloroflexota bacterium]
GGYATGSIDSYLMVGATLAQTTGIKVLIPEYRLAPEHPFPAALEDALAAYRWLLRSGTTSQRIIFAGDSAGGGLAVAALSALRDAGAPLPRAAVLISPFVDLEGTGESLRTRAAADPYVKPEDKALLRYYIGSHDPRHPLLSPLYADLRGLPPLLIHVGDDEILLSDSTRLAEKATDAGVDVTLKIWPGMWHVFHFFAPLLPEARQALAEMGAYAQKQWQTRVLA